MTSLRWAPDAVQDLARLRDFLGDKDHGAAERAALRIREAAAVLRARPELGRVVPDEAFRDLVVPFGGGAYGLRYRIDVGAVMVVRVGHSREERE
jgi:plasmid stabilization system protein ParE